MYRAWVTQEWPGQVTGVSHSGNCYSLWQQAHDLAPSASYAQSSFATDIPRDGTEGMVTNGYYCSDLTYCSITFVESNPWWRADLGSPRRVATILLKTREDMVRYTTMQVTMTVKLT